MAKEKDKICFYCNNPISKTEKQAQVITKHDNKIIGDESFHFICWNDYFRSCVKNKLENLKQNAFGMVKKMFGELDG